MHKTDPVIWADLYSAGFSIFPLHTQSKRPALASWEPYQFRRPSEEELVHWGAGDTAYNIGIATGAISGIVVLDLDSEEASAIAEQRGLPATVEAKTPRGRHLFFKHPSFHVPNMAGNGKRLPRGIDVRGDGGYVVGHGSYFVPTVQERLDGKREGAYHWLEGRSPDDIGLADMPQWLIDACSRRADDNPPLPMPDALTALRLRLGQPSGREEAYATAALASECDGLRYTPEGSRNQQLNASAFNIARLVAGGGLDEHHARDELESAARQVGLESREIRKTIESAFDAGRSSPRTAPEIHVSEGARHLLTQSSDRLCAPLIMLRSAADASRSTPPAREFLLQEWLPVGATTVLFGDGGTGKSLVAMMMATVIAAGANLWGMATIKAPTLAFYCEDDDSELDRRQQAINRVLGIDPKDLSGCYFESRFGKSSLLGCIAKSGDFVTNELFAQIRKEAIDTGARLVILDNINMVFGNNINDPGAVTRFMAALNGLALEINGTVLLVGHIAKNEGSKFAGTMAWSNASRNRLFLGRPDNPSEAARNPDLRHLSRDKSNYARTGEHLSLIWDRGAFLRPEDISPANASLSNAEVTDNRVFLDLLDEFTRKGKPLSINNQASNYAPRVMATKGNTRNADTQRRMTNAMARLLESHAIVEVAPLGFKLPNRKEAHGIKRADADTPTPAIGAYHSCNPLPSDRPEVMSLLDSLKSRAG